MFLSTTQDVWYSVASVCLAVITVFLCIALYELIKVLRQTDEVISETREKVEALEEGVEAIVEKVTGALSYMGILSQAGKQIMSFLSTQKKKPSLANNRKRVDDEEVES